jgi:hypothetical protein
MAVVTPNAHAPTLLMMMVMVEGMPSMVMVFATLLDVIYTIYANSKVVLQPNRLFSTRLIAAHLEIALANATGYL